MNMKHSSDITKRLALVLALGVALAALSLRAEDLVPLPIKLPLPAFMGDVPPIPPGVELEKVSDKPRPPFLAPKGCVNLALKKPVTSSDKSPVIGSLELVTDGDKEASDDSAVVLHKNTQWVQIDLEKSAVIHAIVVWHDHQRLQIYHDVVVRVSDDPNFIRNTTTVYSNDRDGSSGLGIGTDKAYWENYEGRLMPVKAVKGRYVRCYSQGSTDSGLNRYTEVEVWGLPPE